MSKIRSFTVLVCMLSAANAWGAAFKDDFNRANGAVGNGWTTQTDGTIKVEIVDNEVLIAGTQATDWVRCGLRRPVSGETRVSFDFLANNAFNFHVRVDSAGNSAYVEIYAWPGGPMTHANSLDGGWPGWVEIAGSNMTAGEYNNFVLEQEGTKFTITLNGTVVGSVTNANFTSIESVLLSSDSATGTTGSLHFDNVQIGVILAGTARDPSPAHNATDVPRDVAVGWTPGEYANTHNVYLGTSFEDVNQADVTKAVSKGQTETTFDPADLLAYNTTYYWRIDEVNAPPGAAIFKGDVWSFTTEPYTYWITGVTATASSSAPNMGPEKTVNGSGLTNGLHSSVDTDMWLSAPATPLPAWIRYQFDRAYVLDAMTVWNSNQKIESYIGFGAKGATIEYSLDGTTWTTLGDVEIARATGADGDAGAVINLAGVPAKFVRLTITSTWGGFIPQAGLSEVRFSYIPVVARQPSPAVGATDVSLDAVLDWRDGREAASHKVYLSTDKQAVVDGTAPVATTTESRYQPASFEFGTICYWRVDEVNDAPASSWPGDVWNFSTTEYAVIDDFESYNDEEGKGTRIYETWIDGWTNNNGSTVGNWEPPFAERTIVHGGSQSMPMDYNNINSPFYSEAVRTWSSPQDWTTHGATDLSLWFRGAPVGFAESAAGAITMSASGTDIWGNADQFRFAYKRLAANGSITARVDSLVRTDGWAKAGVMVRESLDAGSKHAAVVVTPDNGVSFPWRLFANDISDQINQTGVAAPYWIRITRTGNTLKAEHSADGKTWSSVGTDAAASSKDITMTGTIYIGLALTSHNAGAVTVAEFSNITVTGGTGSWLVAEIGADHPGNDPDQLYVTVEDSTGKKATVTHPDPAAVNAGDWTEWRIPQSSFTGVNLAKVKKLSLGVGDQSTKGQGKLYIDDVRFGRLVAAPPVVAGNLMVNGGFEDGVLVPWALWGATAEVVSQGAVEGGSCLHVTVPAAGVNFWDSGLNQPGFVFEARKKYTVSAFLKCSSGTMDINFKPELQQDPWTGYGEKRVTMTNEWAEYSVTTPVFAADTSPGSVTFHIGFAAGDFWIDGVRFYEGDYVPPDEK